MDGVGFSVAIGALKAIAFVYDVLTFPFYVILQRPWRVRQLSRSIKGIIVDVEREPSKDFIIDTKQNHNDLIKHFRDPSREVEKVVAGYFLQGLEHVKGCPKTLRCDLGTENVIVERLQKSLHQLFNKNPSNKPCFLYGKSCHNQRIESWWGILRKHCSQFWMNLFQMLKEDNYFDGTFADKSLIQFCFMELIQAKIIQDDAKSVTYRSTVKPKEHHVTLIREKIDTMAKMFEYCSKKYPNKRCLGTREILAEEDELQPNGRVFKKFVMGDYKWKTFSEVNILASHFGKGLRELGNPAGRNIAIFAETRAEWMIAAHGIFKQSIPLVTIYATLGDEAIAHAINETEVSTIVTSFDLLPKFKKILQLTPRVQTLIYMEDQLKVLESCDGYKEGVQIIKFEEILKQGAKSTIVAQHPKPEDVAVIMYTSGSTGVPKGVILLQKNLIATLKGFCDSTPIFESDIMIGFLPLAHIFELLVESVCQFSGVPVGYSGALTMTDNSSKIKKGTKGDATVLCPTVLTSVPLILDRISKSIQEKVAKSSNLKKVIFKFAYDYKVSWKKRGYETPLIDKVVFAPITKIVGGNMRLMISGGAPLTPETHEQISTCLCIRIIQGYGLTETTSCACVQDLYDMSYGRAGAPCTICDIKLISWEEGNYRITDKPFPRGEIMIGGENISIGYYKLEEKTKEEFFEEDGKRWFRTGDIGEVHEDGVIKIIDRKKDLVKLQAGEYVSLGKVEAGLKTCPLVDNICVYGESTKEFCVALVVPNQQQLHDLAAKKGVENKSFEDLCINSVVEKAVVQELAEHGKKSKLAKFEIPTAVKLVTEVWSPDMGLVTAAFKLKRKEIQDRYKHEINRMYAS